MKQFENYIFKVREIGHQNSLSFKDLKGIISEKREENYREVLLTIRA